MNIDDLNKRWFSLKDDANKTLVEAVRALGGAYDFVDKNDESLDEIDDLSELGLPLVDAYACYTGQLGSFYVISIVHGKYGLEFYGINECNYSDVTHAIQLDHVSLGGILDILESLPEINKQ